MNLHLLLLVVSPVFGFSSDQMFLVRRRPSNYLSPSGGMLGYSSPLIVSPQGMEGEHRPLQLASTLRHVIRDPHLEMAAGRHLPASLSRLLMKPRRLEEPAKEPLYYYIASSPKHKEPSFLTGRNFQPITQPRPRATKFVPTALKRDFLMDDEIPLSMAEDTSFPIYSAHKKPLLHLMRPQLYDEFDQSGEQNAPLIIQPRPIMKDRSPLIMRSIESSRHHPFHVPRYYDVDPGYSDEYQRPRPLWGRQRGGLEEGQFEDQRQVEENENKSRQNGEKKKRKKKKKKKKVGEGEKVDKEWMAVPEVMTSEEMREGGGGGGGGEIEREIERRSAVSDEVDWSRLQQGEILRVNKNETSF